MAKKRWKMPVKNNGDRPRTADPYEAKNPAAVELGRLGGAKGGKVGAESLTLQRRSERAEAAARAGRGHRQRRGRNRREGPSRR